METRAHHVLIGAFTLGVFLLALGFVLWLSKSSVDHTYNDYDIVFTEAVTGLSTGGLVQYNGIKVGEVRALSLAADDPRKVIARVRHDAAAPVRKDTRAKLALQGVTGVAFIQLSGGAPSSPPLLPTPEHPVPVIPSEESALSKLLASGSDIVLSANDALLRMNQILSDENVKRISDTLEHIDQLSGALAGERTDISTALQQLAEASGQLKKTLGTLDSMANTTNALIRDDVAVGYPVNMAMKQVNLFPHMVIQMAAIGEEAGALDAMLFKVAEYYEQEVNNAVDALSSLLEPVIMVFIGVVVGAMVIAMYLPIFKLAATI